MRRSRYSFQVIFRIILIAFTCYGFVWLILYAQKSVTALFVIILLVIQVFLLIRFHTQTLKDLLNFLLFLEENDTTISFTGKRIEKNFQGLTFQLEKINDKIRTARIENERQYHYLQKIINQVETGIMVFDENGKVNVFNPATAKLLGIKKLREIRSLEEMFPDLTACLLKRNNLSNQIIKVRTPEGERILSVKCGKMRFDEKFLQIVSLQNIKPEMEAGELDAWRKLIRIQRHEIINSLTPITTLTTAMKHLLHDFNPVDSNVTITGNKINDILNSIEVIEERSKGLIGFMEHFKSLTDLTGLKLSQVKLKILCERVALLYSVEFKARGIHYSQEIFPENLSVTVDEKLLEQVLINLIKNSCEALVQTEGEKKISIAIFRSSNDTIIIQIIDNGAGISPEAIELLFVPSYTTKENGSGIGLSVSRQIIQMHHGTIEVSSNPGIKTVFEIVLPTIPQF